MPIGGSALCACVSLVSRKEQRFPKPKVGGSTPLGTAMKSNENFRFVARARPAQDDPECLAFHVGTATLFSL